MRKKSHAGGKNRTVDHTAYQGLSWKITKLRIAHLRIDLCLATSMESSRRNLLNQNAKRRLIFKIYILPSFYFHIAKTCKNPPKQVFPFFVRRFFTLPTWLCFQFFHKVAFLLLVFYVVLPFFTWWSIHMNRPLLRSSGLLRLAVTEPAAGAYFFCDSNCLREARSIRFHDITKNTKYKHYSL